ncbi:MAG: hypothetical protein PHX18_08990 [Candidatus Gastranaerophilales bacterium]|nr:hypothetical protein [Candidatus Gastranaerophilales bacterium]
MLRVTKLAVLIIFLAFIGIQSVKAETPLSDYMDPGFMSVQGYSPETIRIIELNKAKTFGEELPKPSESSSSLVRWWKKFIRYSDPATDIGDFGTHIIYPYNTINDY